MITTIPSFVVKCLEMIGCGAIIAYVCYIRHNFLTAISRGTHKVNKNKKKQIINEMFFKHENRAFSFDKFLTLYQIVALY